MVSRVTEHSSNKTGKIDLICQNVTIYQIDLDAIFKPLHEGNSVLML